MTSFPILQRKWNPSAGNPLSCLPPAYTPNAIQTHHTLASLPQPLTVPCVLKGRCNHLCFRSHQLATFSSEPLLIPSGILCCNFKGSPLLPNTHLKACKCLAAQQQHNSPPPPPKSLSLSTDSVLFALSSLVTLFSRVLTSIKSITIK